ncbi:DNA-packaging protein [Roseinatronobacter alkalisoli]|uniref:Terminase family protein n=1 Tax=Roseinatronobacter alkalisoli TaxID=3028235 RepID=A0ABT5TEA3_9RHOB|nr:terminase family protein [Roseinatronobacter sp. HJB301]MDD7973435.1 terminase family protein [Roseinatronobacter sp. HJB301]
MTSSLLHSMLSLSEPERHKVLATLTESQAAELLYDWNFWGRPNQQLPAGDWFVWMILAGRGWGKTRTAVENISRLLRGPTPLTAPKGAPAMMSFIADNPFDMRQYSIEGLSGFAHVGPPEWRPIHEPSKRTLTWPNGCKALLFSAEDPEALRGASGSFFWWDELAKSRYARAGWDNLMFGMREGNPRGIVTTTPRPIPLMRELVDSPSTHVTKGSTWDNKLNLSGRYFETVIKPRMGTRLGKQEIDGQLLDDVQGALWGYDVIDAARITYEKVPGLQRIVVAVDPSGGGDDIGIVVAGEGFDGTLYVLFDATCNLSPGGWARRVNEMYTHFGADRIVAERNFGGDMVESNIRSVDPLLPVTMVTASRGKVVRAEPVAALYEQGRVKHAGHFDELEAQMYHMTTHGFIGEGSPDRVDALVWAMTELALTKPERDRGVSGQRELG